MAALDLLHLNHNVLWVITGDCMWVIIGVLSIIDPTDQPLGDVGPAERQAPLPVLYADDSARQVPGIRLQTHPGLCFLMETPLCMARNSAG